MKRVLSLLVTCAVVVGVGFTVAAGVRKVQVMPVDGNADPALRTKFNAMLQKMAHSIDGKVTVSTTSFADAAVAVGCDATQPACADQVLATLGADELVWGTATTDATTGQTTLVVKRATKGVPPNEQTVTLTAQDPPEKAEQGVQPLFGPVAALGSGSGSVADTGSGSGSGSAAPSQPWSRDKKLGIGIGAGGGVLLVVGFAFWASESNLQGQINSHPTNTLADVQATKKLEDQAASDALWGNVLVVAGLAAAGVGAYYLWQDHKAHETTVAPVPVDNGTGAVLVVGGHW